MRKKIVCIGAGNMAEALVRGMLRSGAAMASQITVTDPDAGRLQLFTSSYAVGTSASNTKPLEEADIVVLAVKPQVMKDVLAEIKPFFAERWLIISIAAGIRAETIESGLGAGSRVVRVMPNTPALVGAGISAVCAGKEASRKDLDEAKALLVGVGDVVEVDESAMDAVTAMSGSGPAYVFYFMEAMQAAAKKLNFDEQTARKLIYATFEGAARLAKNSDVDVVELRRRVTSKGGTTAAALDVMAKGGVFDVFVEAIMAAHDRSKELSKG